MFFFIPFPCGGETWLVLFLGGKMENSGIPGRERRILIRIRQGASRC